MYIVLFCTLPILSTLARPRLERKSGRNMSLIKKKKQVLFAQGQNVKLVKGVPRVKGMSIQSTSDPMA